MAYYSIQTWALPTKFYEIKAWKPDTIEAIGEEMVNETFLHPLLLVSKPQTSLDLSCMFKMKKYFEDVDYFILHPLR